MTPGGRPGPAGADEGRATTLTEMRALVGQYVTITLDWTDPEGQVSGHLLYITDDGEVAYVKDDKTWYGWPCLAVAPSSAARP